MPSIYDVTTWEPLLPLMRAGADGPVDGHVSPEGWSIPGSHHDWAAEQAGVERVLGAPAEDGLEDISFVLDGSALHLLGTGPAVDGVFVADAASRPGPARPVGVRGHGSGDHPARRPRAGPGRLAGLPRLRTLAAGSGSLADPREVALLTDLEYLEIDVDDWRVILDADAAPNGLSAAGVRSRNRDLLAVAELSNELLARWNRPLIARTTLHVR